ncbi:GINS complex subunit 3, partial [Lecanoromycetidae sp. Uapishka_2]
MGSYYNIDAILTDAQKVPCKFSLDIPGLGYLDDNAGGDIKKDVSISLPLWLYAILSVQRIGPASAALCELDLPPSLSPRVLNALKADAKTVDLRALCGHFYEFSTRVLELYPYVQEAEDMTDLLSEAFQKRAREIGDHANNLRGALGEGAHFLRGLDEMERQRESVLGQGKLCLTDDSIVFRAAHDSSKATRVWMGEMKKKS